MCPASSVNAWHMRTVLCIPVSELVSCTFSTIPIMSLLFTCIHVYINNNCALVVLAQLRLSIHMRTRSSYLEPHSCRSTHMCTCSASKVVRTMDGKRKLMTLFNVGVTRVRRHCTTHASLCFALLYGSYYWPLLSLIAPPQTESAFSAYE